MKTICNYPNCWVKCSCCSGLLSISNLLLQLSSAWPEAPTPAGDIGLAALTRAHRPEQKRGCISQQLILTWFQRSFPYFIWLSWSLAYWKGKANLTTVGRSSLSRFQSLPFSLQLYGMTGLGKGSHSYVFKKGNGNTYMHPHPCITSCHLCPWTI